MYLKENIPFLKSSINVGFKSQRVILWNKSDYNIDQNSCDYCIFSSHSCPEMVLLMHTAEEAYYYCETLLN